MGKKSFCMFVSICLLVVITGCSTLNSQQPTHEKRVLALTPFMMENLFILGITPVGKVEEYACRAEGISLPSVGKQRNINMEAIYKVKPDVIFAQNTFHGSMRESLEATGAKVIFLDSKGSSGVDLEILNKMGEILNKTAEATAYIEKIENLSAEIKKKTENSPLKTAIILLDTADKLYAYHPASFHADIVARVGLKNVVPINLPLVRDNGVGSAVAYDIETIMQQDPDVIFVRNGSATENDTEKIKQKYYDNPLYQELRAVKNKHVYVLPAKVNTGNISVEDALKLVAQLVYPEIFK